MRWERQIAIQQKLIWHADIRTTMNPYCDMVPDETSNVTRRLFTWHVRE
jgi:hypothetical protein